MKKFLLALLLFVPNHAWATYTLVAHTIAKSTDTFGVTTSNIDTTGANLLIVIIGDYVAESHCTFSDNKSNSWTALNDYTCCSFNRIHIVHIVGATVGAGHNFTCTLAQATFPTIGILAWSGAKTSAPFDVQNGNNSGGVASSIQPGSGITPTENNELVVTGLSFDNSNTASINSGFTIADQIDFVSGTSWGIAVGYIVQTNAGLVNPTWSLSPSTADLATDIASFKAAPAAAGGPNVGSLSSMGIGK